MLVLSALTVIAEEVQDENVAKSDQTSTTDVEEGRGRRRFYKFLIKACETF